MFVPVEEKLTAGLKLECWQIHTVEGQKITTVSLRCDVKKWSFTPKLQERRKDDVSERDCCAVE